MSTSPHAIVSDARRRTVPFNMSISPDDGQFASVHQKWTKTLIWAILVVTFSTSFVMGVNIGGPNSYNGFIIPWARGYPFPCQKEDAVAQWVARVWWGCNYTVSVSRNRNGYYYLPSVASNRRSAQDLIDAVPTICFVLGGAVGGLTGQYWYSFLTRRDAIVISMLYQLLASILMVVTLNIYSAFGQGDPDLVTIAQALQNKEIAIALLYLSRFLSGCSAGTGSVATTIYLTDISPRTIRGNIVTLHQVFIVIGILVGQIVGLPWFLGRHNTWHWGMSWVGLFSLLGLVVLWTLPESPRWLVQQQERNEAAVSLRTLRHSSMIEEELDEIIRQEATIGAADVSMSVLFTSPRFRWPIVTSIALNAVQQFSGINTVFFYSGSTFASIGFHEEKTYWGILSTGLVNLVATVVTVKLVEFYGRRPLILYSLLVITVTMILLCIFIELNIKTSAVVQLVLTLIFIAMFAIGLGPIPYIYPNEVFAINVRPAAVSVSMCACWVFNTMVTVLFPPLQEIFHGYVFLIFCVCCLLAFGLFWFKMAETKQKKLSEIEAFWMDK